MAAFDSFFPSDVPETGWPRLLSESFPPEQEMGPEFFENAFSTLLDGGSSPHPRSQVPDETLLEPSVTAGEFPGILR
jgi:hypothetical protein